jgi:uncharacterized OB-fold protein
VARPGDAPAVRFAAADLVEVDDGGGVRLVGGHSPSSGLYHFPLMPICPYTGAADVDRVLLSDRGTLWGWTAVTTAPPGYRGEVPYGFGIVELTAERLLVVGRLTEPDPGRLAFGDPMRVVAQTVYTDDDGTAVATWAFTPEGQAP